MLRLLNLTIVTMKIIISKAVSIGLMLFGLGGVVTCLAAESGNPPTEKTFAAPHGLKVSIKMIGPYGEPADLQIICIEDLVIEAGPTFFDSAVKQVSEGIEAITGVLAERTAAPYISAAK
jgi:hypothetical protein